MRKIGLFSFVLFVTACSGAQDPSAEGFFGTWVFRSGGAEYSCADGSSGQLGIREGTKYVFAPVDDDKSAASFDYSAECVYPMVALSDDTLAHAENGNEPDCVYEGEQNGIAFVTEVRTDLNSTSDLSDDGTSVHIVENFSYRFLYETYAENNCTLNLDTIFRFYSSDVVRR